MAIAIATVSPRRAGIIICDHVDDLFVGGVRQIGDRPVHSLFLDLADFLQRQVGLGTTRRSRFLVAFDEFAG